MTVDATPADAAGVESADADAAGVELADADAAGVESADADAAGVDTAAVDWSAATSALAEALAGLTVGGVLTLAPRSDTRARIAIGALPDGTLRAEADPPAAEAIGWSVREADRGEHPMLAAAVTAALHGGLGVADPAQIVVSGEDTWLPAALTAVGGPASLGSDPASIDLEERALLGVAEAIGADPRQLTRDEDGDIPVRSGSAVVFVRVVPDPALVRVFAPVVADVPFSAALLDRLNDLNSRHLLARAAYRSGAVVIDVPLIGDGLVPAQVGIALTVIAELADELDDVIVQEFGGRRFLDDGAKPPTDEPGLGGYI